jgi:hypothetical protein
MLRQLRNRPVPSARNRSLPPENTASSPSSSVNQFSDRVLSLQRTVGNYATRQLLQRDNEVTGAAPTKAPSKTAYMGMNPGSRKEAAHLKGLLKDDVLISLNDPTLEKTLKTEVGVLDWIVRELPVLLLVPDKFLKAYDGLLATDPEARDQMAHVFKMFYSAQLGQFTLERLVLSGHSNGVQLWGDADAKFKPGSFLLTRDLHNLTEAFPVAAAQVQDVMFSACYTVSSVEAVIKAFPNVRTIWTYAGKSPAAGAGAEEHISKWDKETRGDQTMQEEDGMGKSAIWTRDAAKASKKGDGFVRNDPAKASLHDLDNEFFALRIDAKEQLEGNKPLHQDTLNNAYNYIQMILAHPDSKTSPDRADYEYWRDTLLRLRFHTVACTRFGTEYASEIKAGYTAIGRKAPNFAGMNRQSLKAELSAFAAALKATPNAEAQTFYDKYLQGLWKLDTKIIPDGWL